MVDATCEADQHWFCQLRKQGHDAPVVELIKIQTEVDSETEVRGVAKHLGFDMFSVTAAKAERVPSVSKASDLRWRWTRAEEHGPRGGIATLQP